MLLCDLQLMNLGFGVYMNLKCPNRLSRECNPGGEGYIMGCQGGLCTQMHCTYLNTTVLPSYCIAVDFLIVFPARVAPAREAIASGPDLLSAANKERTSIKVAAARRRWQPVKRFTCLRALNASTNAYIAIPPSGQSAFTCERTRSKTFRR